MYKLLLAIGGLGALLTGAVAALITLTAVTVEQRGLALLVTIIAFAVAVVLLFASADRHEADVRDRRR
jgi:hypothetical protein